MDKLVGRCGVWSLATFLLLLAGVAQAQDAKDPGQARIEAARSLYESATATLEVGQGDPEEVYRWSIRWMNAERERHPERSHDALVNHRDRMTLLRATVRKLAESGLVAVSSSLATEFYLSEAEFWLQQT